MDKGVPVPVRHGDVLLIPLSGVQGELSPIARDPRRGVVLAFGESTSHAHRLTDDWVQLWEPKGLCSFFVGDKQLIVDIAGGGVPRVLDVPRPTMLYHHDHGLGVPDGAGELATPIEKGRYLVVRQRERSFMDIAGYRRVAD